MYSSVCKVQEELVDDSFAPLLCSGPNQVETFLTEHGGPGIQHIGLHTSNITEAVATLKDNGVEFIDPPSTYYSEVCCDSWVRCRRSDCVVLWINNSSVNCY